MTSDTDSALAGLLRGGVVWRDDRPWADNDALAIVADYLEEKGWGAEAQQVRLLLNWDAMPPEGDMSFSVSWLLGAAFIAGTVFSSPDAVGAAGRYRVGAQFG